MTPQPPTSPDASVIVLNYDGASIVGRCLEHLLGQTFQDFEVVVVDNASTDGSAQILRQFETHDRIRVVWSEKNLGVAGGRNLGLEHARGRIIAFIDNDGFADPDWLESGILCFEDESVGALASVVFFDRKKVVLNGAGGTLNLRGYGGDHCFRAPYEFARLPQDVLYPMGCGMMIRRSLMEEIGRFDQIIFNYYDDVELGIAVWNAGKRVVVCPDAWVDHEYGSSTTTSHQKVLLCERNRIRTVLKYFPLRQLPRWLLREWELRHYLTLPGLRDIPLRAWIWNLWHLPSAIARRRRVKPNPARYWGLIAQTARQYPLPLPEEHVCEVEPQPTSARIRFGDPGDASSLLFGWYPTDSGTSTPFRWAGPQASVLLRLIEPSSRLRIRAISLREAQSVRLLVRPLGEVDPVWERRMSGVGRTWEEFVFECEIEPGTYEMLLLSDWPQVDHLGRPLGVGLTSLAFEADPFPERAPVGGDPVGAPETTSR